MGFNKKKIFFGKEIIYNNYGQVMLKDRLLLLSVLKFYRYIIRGL